MLTPTRVKEIIEDGASEQLLEAQKMFRRLNMHVTGANVAEYIEEVESFENETQRKLRLKLLKSNKALFSFLTRPIDKVFSAKGGFINYNLPESRIDILKEYIKDVNDGLDIKTYLQKKVLKNYLCDPNGFVMLDIDEFSNIETRFYSCVDVIYIEKRGNNVKSIIFNPYESEDDNDDKKYYRVIDELTDSIYVQDGDTIVQDDQSVISNFFGEVPAYIVGDICDVNSNNFLSLLDDVLEDAEELLHDVSIKTVHKLSQGFAKYWQYPENCNQCGGEGEVKRTVDGGTETVECPSCQGGGIKQRKSPSDVMLLDIPTGEEVKVAPDVGGYINPSIEIWDQYNKEVDRIKASMFQSMWGATFTEEGNNDTATGKWLDSLPVQDRITNISTTFSKVYNFLLSFYGKAAFLNPRYEATVSLGNQYLTQSTDEALEAFKEAHENKLPHIVQMDLLSKYYQSEYQSNDLEYQNRIKMLSVDPFPFNTILEVKEMGIDDEDYKCKVYLTQWANQLEEAKIVLMDKEQLKEDLKQFVSLKNISNEQSIQAQQTD